jgi:hypothetical protein
MGKENMTPSPSLGLPSHTLMLTAAPIYTDERSLCQQNAEITQNFLFVFLSLWLDRGHQFVEDDNHGKSVFFVLVKTVKTVLFEVLPHNQSLLERLERGDPC